MLTLFHAPSSRSGRIIWLLEESGLEYALRYVSITYGDGSGGGPDPANLHPDKKVPALLHDGALVTESTAVAIYVSDLVPQAGLAPRVGDADRGAFLTWMCWLDNEFGPAIFQRLAAGAGAPETPAFLAARKRLEGALAQKPFLLGDRFSAADVMLGGALIWARDVIGEAAWLDGYLDRLTRRPAYARAQDRDAAPAASAAA